MAPEPHSAMLWAGHLGRHQNPLASSIPALFSLLLLALGRVHSGVCNNGLVSSFEDDFESLDTSLWAVTEGATHCQVADSCTYVSLSNAAFNELLDPLASALPVARMGRLLSDMERGSTEDPMHTAGMLVDAAAKHDGARNLQGTSGSHAAAQWDEEQPWMFPLPSRGGGDSRAHVASMLLAALESRTAAQQHPALSPSPSPIHPQPSPHHPRKSPSLPTPPKPPPKPPARNRTPHPPRPLKSPQNHHHPHPPRPPRPPHPPPPLPPSPQPAPRPTLPSLSPSSPGPSLPKPRGLSLVLSQAPCQSNASACCGSYKGKNKCARWSGFHMASQQCLHYGSLEITMAIWMPPGTYSVLYLGLYSGPGPGNVNPWQEIDMGWTGFNVQQGVVTFNGTLITDTYNNGPLTLGPQISLGPWSDMLQFRKYRLDWFNSSLTWSVDNRVVYSLSGPQSVPDLPQSLRVIFRTANGRGDGPSSRVWIQNIKYSALQQH